MSYAATASKHSGSPHDSPYQPSRSSGARSPTARQSADVHSGSPSRINTEHVPSYYTGASPTSASEQSLHAARVTTPTNTHTRAEGYSTAVTAETNGAYNASHSSTARTTSARTVTTTVLSSPAVDTDAALLAELENALRAAHALVADREADVRELQTRLAERSNVERTLAYRMSQRELELTLAADRRVGALACQLQTLRDEQAELRDMKARLEARTVEVTTMTTTHTTELDRMRRAAAEREAAVRSETEDMLRAMREQLAQRGTLFGDLEAKLAAATHDAAAARREAHMLSLELQAAQEKLRALQAAHAQAVAVHESRDVHITEITTSRDAAQLRERALSDTLNRERAEAAAALQRERDQHARQLQAVTAVHQDALDRLHAQHRTEIETHTTTHTSTRTTLERDMDALRAKLQEQTAAAAQARDAAAAAQRERDAAVRERDHAAQSSQSSHQETTRTLTTRVRTLEDELSATQTQGRAALDEARRVAAADRAALERELDSLRAKLREQATAMQQARDLAAQQARDAAAAAQQARDAAVAAVTREKDLALQSRTDTQTSLQEANRTLTARVRTLEGELAAAHTQARGAGDDARRASDTLQQQLTELRSRYELTVKQLADMTSKHDALVVEEKRLQAQIVERETVTTSQQLIQLEASKIEQTYRKQLKEAHEKIAEVETEKMTVEGDLQLKIMGLQSTIRDRDDEIADLRKRVSTLQSQVNSPPHRTTTLTMRSESSRMSMGGASPSPRRPATVTNDMRWENFAEWLKGLPLN